MSEPKDFGSGYLDTTGAHGASGWQVYPSSSGWQWSAYGRLGSTHGTARTKADAEKRAQDAERQLRGASAGGGR